MRNFARGARVALVNSVTCEIPGHGRDVVPGGSVGIVIEQYWDEVESRYVTDVRLWDGRRAVAPDHCWKLAPLGEEETR